MILLFRHDDAQNTGKQNGSGEDSQNELPEDKDECYYMGRSSLTAACTDGNIDYIQSVVE